ncbi:ABC transporter substrate-binding protein [Propionibacteriaceae bacterium Y2011]
MTQRRDFLKAAVAVAAVSGPLALAACSDTGGGPGGQSIKVGISQFVQHPALDAATAGFKEALAAAGYTEGENLTYDEQNAQGEVPNANTIATTFATGGFDLVLAVATPSAQAAAQAITDIPVLFTAVTDPVAAGLVSSNEAPGANITGTSDINPVAEQLELLTEIAPEAKRVGIVYSSGEVNSEVQVELAKEAAGELGLEIVEATVSNASDIQQATTSLGDVDAIYVPTDNVVVAGLAALVQIAEQRDILVVGAEAGTVESGAVATVGIDYGLLGQQTGEMAVRILKDGADPATTPVETSKEFELVINPGAAERMGVEIPQSVVDRADRTIE